ncbi:hypothetical protein ACRRTK_021424 [Alexandromys fortis]
MLKLPRTGCTSGAGTGVTPKLLHGHKCPLPVFYSCCFLQRENGMLITPTVGTKF